MKGKRVCVAVDGSPAADAAVAVGLELAAVLGSSVRFVHAASPLADQLFADNRPDGPTPEQIAASDPVLGSALTRARDAGIDAEVELLANESSDDLAATLAGIANGIDAGLIVCGSRGRSSAAGAVLGSVSHNLIKRATLPVLIVHAPAGE